MYELVTQQAASGIFLGASSILTLLYQEPMFELHIFYYCLFFTFHSHLRLIQQAVAERKQFEEKQQQLATLHIHQQQELHKKQQLLRQMQEAQLANLQRQIFIQNMATHPQRVSD